MKAADATTRKKLEVILHRAFIETRKLALAGAVEQIHDLADTFELVTTFLADGGNSEITRVRELLDSYQRKYPGLAFDYVSILNMPTSEFTSVFEAREAF